jgi:hypothetical protein
MGLMVRDREYFYTRVEDKPGNAYASLAKLAREDVNLLGFSVVPFGPNHVEFTLFPDDSAHLISAAAKLGWTLTGPQHALLIQGDDRLGALAEIHQALFDAGVSVFASSGVTDGRGHFGYVIYVRESDHEAAARVLSVK